MATLTPTLVEVVGLSHSYGERQIIQRLNLSIGKGEVFALIGPTGAGKTTLLRILDLLEVPSSGNIYFDGKHVPKSGKQRLEIRRRMALVHQKPQVFNMSVYDNIACGLRWRGGGKTGIGGKIDHILEIVGLESYKNRNARTLSGGEAQRVALARALVIEPEVLLLDEPTANLDPVSTAKIEQLISYIAGQRQTTLIMATHDMSQAQQLADNVGVLLEGRLVQTGSPNDIFFTPQSKEVANFVGMENIIEGVIIATNEGVVTVNIGDNTVEAVSSYPVGEEVYACIRPEDITLALSKTQSSARNCIQGEVIRVTTIGPLSHVEIDCGFPLVALVTKTSTEELDLQMGRKVYATFKATTMHIIKKAG